MHSVRLKTLQRQKQISVKTARRTQKPKQLCILNAESVDSGSIPGPVKPKTGNLTRLAVKWIDRLLLER